MANYVEERWWHRLLAVFLAIPVILTAVGAAFIAYDIASPYRYYYSWWPGGIPSNIKSDRCKVSLPNQYSDGRVYLCGEFTSGKDFVEDLVAHRVVTPGHLGVRSERHDNYNADALIRSVDLRAGGGKAIQMNLVPKALGTFALSVVIALGVVMALHRLVLYIAHGRNAQIRPRGQP